MSCSPSRALYWLPTVELILHSLEEAPRFPAWATEHFGHTSTAYFLSSHALLIALAVASSHLASIGGRDSVWAMLAAAWQWQFFLNGLFHLVTTVYFDEYSPGLVTGTVLFLPLTLLFFEKTIRHRLLTPRRLALATGVGTAVAALAVASLWMEVTWL